MAFDDTRYAGEGLRTEALMSEEAEPQLPRELTRHRDRILKLAAERGATNVRVFGSLLHGPADEDSDVDILVDLEAGRSLLDLGGLQMALQELLNRPVDLKTPAFLRKDIRDRVEDEAVKL